MKSDKRILILTLSFGAGHIRAARSVATELQTQIPEAEILLIDALENCSLWFRAFYVWTYWAMIRYIPRLWEKFFHLRVQRRDEQTAPVWIWRKGCRKVFGKIKSFQPDLIVAAEVGACEIAAIARRENLTKAAIINVITDFEAEPIWIKKEIAAFCVPTLQVAEQLQNWGADAEKIKICGIPLDKSFSEFTDSDELRKQFGLDLKPIVLLMGGGMGPTSMDAVAARLLKSGENLNVVAVAGKDKSARRKLEKLKPTATVNLKIVGWTDQVADLMEMSAILVTKPGGLTLSEAAECGLPMVFFDAIPGPEKSNAARFADAGAGIETKGSQETANEVLRLLKDKNALAEMAKQCRKLARPNAAKNIVELISDELKNAEIVQLELFSETSQSFESGINASNIGQITAEVQAK